jgi:hypothetical protein
MKHLVLPFILVTLLLFGFSTKCMCQVLPPEWVFDDKAEIANWGGMNNLAPLEVGTVTDEKGAKRTVLKTKSTGVDPYVFPDGGWQGFIADIEPFDGKKYDTIYIGVRVNMANAWQIYYMTKEDPTYTENQHQNIQIDSVDEFKDFEFKMIEGGWNKKTIKGFRLDPGTASGVEAEIDYLSLRGVPAGVKKAAVDSNDKLAITWGSLKR